MTTNNNLREAIGALMEENDEHDGVVYDILMTKAESMIDTVLQDPSVAYGFLEPGSIPNPDSWNLDELVAWALLQMQDCWWNDVAYRWVERRLHERVNTWIADSHAVDPDVNGLVAAKWKIH